MCRLLNLILAWPHLWSYISRALASSRPSFHFPKLHELFHWSGPSLLGNTMVTVLPRADLVYRNKHIRTKHKHTVLLALKFPTRVGWLTYPPWPRGLTSQSWAVIKADTGRTLLSNTRYPLQEQPQVLQNTVYRKELQNQKRLFGQQIHCGFFWAWSLKLGLKLFTADSKMIIFPLDVKLKLQKLCGAGVENWSWWPDKGLGQPLR